MKKLYTLICAGLILSLSTSAQTYSGGTYTAIFAGLWAGNTPTPIWQGAQPPQTCVNCLIQLMGAGTVQLNTSVYLANNSTLLIGSGVTLQIVNSNVNTFTASNFVDLTNIGNNLLVWQDHTSILNAANAGPYDGVLTSYQNTDGTYTLTKMYGNKPLVFNNDAIITTGNGAAFGTTQIGPVSLSGIGTLPIILASFTATLNNGAVDLAWTTALESNSDHIGVQRSTDAGAHWSTIGSEVAKGTSSTSTDYTFTDNKPATGTSEYRLQLVDKDGKYTYSEVKTIRNGLITAVSLYPNPARDYVNVTLGGSSTETVSIRLFNQSGQLLQEKSVSNGGGTTVPLSVSGYPQGDYLIVITGADGSKQTSKLLITK
jgi:hypothetical protein